MKSHGCGIEACVIKVLTLSMVWGKVIMLLDYLVLQKCSCCVAEKYVRAPFPKATEFRASKTLELVYADICGPITSSKINRRKHFFANC